MSKLCPGQDDPKRSPLMTRPLTRLVSLLVLLVAAPCQAQAQRPAAFDPERIFVLGDADLDGRMSLDEYRDFLRSSPRMRDAAANIEPMFRRLDADRDGFLSLAEYRKSFPPKPGSAPAKAEKSTQITPVNIIITADQEHFFEAKIRPVLVTHCAKCHSSTSAKVKGGLRLDSREALRLGGDSGPVIVPGNPSESLLVRAVQYHDDEPQMPPKGKHPDAVHGDLKSNT